MTKQSPGPWSYQIGYVFDAEGCVVAHASGDDGRLCAAAPDMLLALKAIVASDERGQGVLFQEAMEAAVKAIAKAEGDK